LKKQQLDWETLLQKAKIKSKRKRSRSAVPKSVLKMEARIAKVIERRRAKSAERARTREEKEKLEEEKQRRHFEKLMKLSLPISLLRTTLLQEFRAKMVSLY
jgi:septal ring factor EnvC (AmiA/AmiB activator)